ncbi:MAG: cobyrinate a,c-diamide synthase [Bacillota bacterium]|uniref:cobyrinate a,c-diamide synthase n=1 Tax=Desulforudis sp. DRI-14 TaxID=3459793 RepID=UPI003490D736
MINVPRLLVASPSSGQGKTTLTLGLLRALRRRGLAVQPFKAGPDYIDPGHHTRAAGRASRNLDTWLIGDEASRELFQRAVAGTDIAVLEGVMGLYDGLGDGTTRASSAELAKMLRAPVILVVDISRQGASAAAVVLGFKALDPEVHVAGVILNRAGSARHAGLVTEAVARYCRVPVLGVIPREEKLKIPERHLGLFTGAEGDWETVYERLADIVEQHVDLAVLQRLAGTAPALPRVNPWIFAGDASAGTVRVGVARDEAFSFLYADNLDILRHHGAEPIFFSPLHDDRLPHGCALLYFGGGYPELYAGALASNRAMLTAVRSYAAAGGRIYGECGGLIYLGEGLTDLEGRYHPMAGLLPVRAGMAGRRLSLGYVVARALYDNLILRAGEEVRGHVFHYSEADPAPGSRACLTVRQAYGTQARKEGWQAGSVFGSYLHLHFASARQVLQRLLKKQ